MKKFDTLIYHKPPVTGNLRWSFCCQRPADGDTIQGYG